MEAGRLMAGETLWRCLGCGHETVSGRRENVREVRCENCGLPFIEAVRTRRTIIRGVGTNRVADLGLALLLEAQE